MVAAMRYHYLLSLKKTYIYFTHNKILSYNSTMQTKVDASLGR